MLVRTKILKYSLLITFVSCLRWAKIFYAKKRIVSGVEKLEIMRFLVGRFTPFSSGIENLPISFYYI